MKHADFHVGLEFVGSGGFWWRCTDVGTRTVVAIRLDHDSAAWYQGPPYIAKETVFDEHEMMRCHLTEEDAIRTAIAEADASHHPGFPHDVVTRMTTARYETSGPRYPHGGVSVPGKGRGWPASMLAVWGVSDCCFTSDSMNTLHRDMMSFNV